MKSVVGSGCRNSTFARVIIAIATIVLGASSAAAQTPPVDFWFIGAPGGDAHLGAQQGLSEANAQGEFLGLSYRLIETGLSGAPPRAIVAAVDANELLRLAETYREVPVLNVTAVEPGLRTRCLANLFHVIPSADMYAAAERQWRTAHPASQARAQAWHDTFRKYAAAQLNGRYKDAFERDMNDDAWAGWAAVKLLSDTSARDPAAAGWALIDLLKTKLAFDGQKGTDLSFRETGQLRQPLLLVENAKIVGEAPVRGVAGSAGLDSLGAISCPK